MRAMAGIFLPLKAIVFVIFELSCFLQFGIQIPRLKRYENDFDCIIIQQRKTSQKKILGCEIKKKGFTNAKPFKILNYFIFTF